MQNEKSKKEKHECTEYKLCYKKIYFYFFYL